MTEIVSPPPTPKPSRMGRFWATCWRALVKFHETDGELRAASFAYYAFFSLLPLTVLLITIGTRFLGDQQQATDVVFKLLDQYANVDVGSSEQVRITVAGFMKSRLGSGIISSLVVLWCAIRFFQALVHGVNRAWGTKEFSWWHIPVKNLLVTTILASALLIGIIAPAIINGVYQYYFEHRPNWRVMEVLGNTAFWLSGKLLPPLLLFYALILFYKMAPRRKTTWREVWLEALWVTLALGGVQKLFVFYVVRADFNIIYGTFGSVVALLMWIYLTGVLLILGGCFSAARAEIRGGLEDQSEPSHERWPAS
jgi:Ca2+-transporting ATPase